VLILKKCGKTIKSLLSPYDGRFVCTVGSKKLLAQIVVCFDPS